jgi:hypothetical protein
MLRGARKGESRRESRRGVSSGLNIPGLHSRRAPVSKTVSESFPLVLDGANGGALRSVRIYGWKELGENLQGFVDPERTRTGSSKALQQQAKEMTADSLISLVCQAMIRRISSISKIRWGIFGCVGGRGVGG